MRSRVIRLSSRESHPEPGERPPDLALAFLPPGDDLAGRLEELASRWDGGTLLMGCEAVTQFADGRLEDGGCVQCLWFEQPGTRAWVDVVEATREAPPAAEDIERVGDRVSRAGAAFLIADGLRFPVQRFLADLRRRLSVVPVIAGGLASQREPIAGGGARVFTGTRIVDSGCLVVGLEGIAMQVEIVRGWDAASPVYEVTRAAGDVIHEIDGVPAVEWFGRFFHVGRELAPMPATAHHFPLILEGPDPARQGVYRSMRSFDDPPGAVTLWGEVRTGDRVRLGIGNDVSLAEAARQRPSPAPPEAAVVYSCVGRETVLGEHAGAEVEAIHETLGRAPLAGFFTFGEIGPTPPGGLAFYNHTAVVALLSEERPERPERPR